jgi:transcriptional regulator with XRE-family HTH domain
VATSRDRPEAVKALADLMERHGLSQGDAACVLGLGKPYTSGQVQVSRWLDGSVSPPATLAAAVDGARVRLAEFPQSWRAKFDRESGKVARREEGA